MVHPARVTGVNWSRTEMRPSTAKRNRMKFNRSRDLTKGKVL